MPSLFEKTVSAICYEIARTQGAEAAPAEVTSYSDVTDFVLGQWRRMPRFWAWPLRWATVAFAMRGFLAGGVPFHRLAPDRRGLLMESWRHSSIGPCRDLIRLYRSLALLALYSRGPAR